MSSRQHLPIAGDSRSQLSYNRETVEVPGGTNGQIHLSGIPTRTKPLARRTLTRGLSQEG
jgi:hypothetical protein